MERIGKTLTDADIFAINHRMIMSFGGRYIHHNNNLANPGPLYYILEAIQSPIFGHDLYPSIIEKAAAIGWRIMRESVFHDGNKRTGMESIRNFLHINGYSMRINKQDIIEMAERVSAGKIEFLEFAEWVKGCAIKD